MDKSTLHQVHKCNHFILKHSTIYFRVLLSPTEAEKYNHKMSVPSDMVFISKDGHRHEAHRNIIKEKCPILAPYLVAGHVRHVLVKQSARAVDVFLKFLYTASIEVDALSSQAIDVSSLAQLATSPALAALCQIYLEAQCQPHKKNTTPIIYESCPMTIAVTFR